MKHINFLSAKSTSWASWFNWEFNYFLMMLIFVMLVLFASLYGFVQHKHVETLKAKQAAVSAIVEQLKISNAKLANRHLSDLAIAKTLGNPVLWSEVLDRVTAQIPKNIYLKIVKGTIVGERTLVVAGESAYIESIIALKNSLSSLSECAGVKLLELAQGELSESDQFNFQIECRIK